MTLLLLAVGRLRAAYRDACDDYLRRLARYARVEEAEVREASRAPTVEAQREEEAERLRARLPAGATVVAVCQAEPERAAAVATRRGYRFPLLCDPERTAYRAYGLLEGTPAQILHDFPWRPNDMETAQTMFCEPRRGTERAVVDSPWQLPGEFVVATDGVLVLTHRYQYCEDFPPKTVLLGAVAAAQR